MTPPDPALPESFAADLADIRSRLEVLERTPRVPNISTSALGIQAGRVLGDWETAPTSATTYGDCATVGPTVTVEVGETGRLIVLITSAFSADGDGDCLMSFRITGPETVAASDDYAIGAQAAMVDRKGGSFLIEDLTPGTYTVTAKYRAYLVVSGKVRSRHLIAIPL